MNFVSSLSKLIIGMTTFYSYSLGKMKWAHSPTFFFINLCDMSEIR